MTFCSFSRAIQRGICFFHAPTGIVVCGELVSSARRATRVDVAQIIAVPGSSTPEFKSLLTFFQPVKVLAPAKFGIFSLFLIILIPCVKNVFAGVLTLWHSLRIELIFFTTFMGHTPHMPELSIQTPGVSKSHFLVLLCGLCDMSDETFGDCVKGISKIFCGWQCNLSPYFRKY